MTESDHIESKNRSYFPFFRKVFRTLFSRRGLKVMGSIFVALVTLVALFYAVENWRGARAWNQVKSEMESKGEPFAIEELVPPMPPEDENFAMTPFFKGLFDKSIDPETGETVWKIRFDQTRLPDWPTELKEFDWRLGEVHQFNWETRKTNISDIDITAIPAKEAVHQLLKQSQPVLDEIEQAVRQRPYSQFPIHYEDNVSALLPHLSQLKGLARLFMLRAHWHIASENAEQALADVETVLMLGETLTNEPFLISGLVRNAIFYYSINPIFHGTSEQIWNENQVRQIQNRLQAIDVLKTYGLNMRGEWMMNIELIDILAKNHPQHDWDVTEVFNDPDYFILPKRILERLKPHGWYLYGKAFISQLHMDYSLPAIDARSRRYHPDKMRAYVDLVEANYADNYRLGVAKQLLPEISKAAIRFVETQTSINLAMIACALERYRIEEGRYPDELDALVPDYLDEVPHDILDGRPLRYRSDGGTFSLYSIGANLTDDGGVHGKIEKFSGPIHDRTSGDWLWRHPQP